MSRSATAHAGIGIAVVLAVVGAFLVLLWKLGFLSFSGTEPSATVVAAAIALVGALFGTLITAVGLLLKHSIDSRAERRLELEAERNAEHKRESERRLALDEERNNQLKQDAEARLRLEAAIRAVELMKATKDEPDPSVQRAGALFSLASLGQFELTLSLALSLFDRQHIDAATYADVVDSMFEKCSGEVQERAISSLVDRARQMVTPLGIALPQRLIDNPGAFNAYSRRWFPVLLTRIITVRSMAEWRPHKYQLYALLSALCVAWMEERDPLIRDGMAAALLRLLRAYDGPPSFYHPRRTVDVGEMRKQLCDGPRQGDEINEVVSLLDNWLERNAAAAAAQI